MQRSVQLIRGIDNQVVEAVLLTLAQNHIDDFENLWKEQLRLYGQEDKYWDWLFKKRISISRDNYESYAIEYQGKTQGLLWIETQQHRSQVEVGHRLIYIEALASAPWNRRAIQRPPELKGVGTLLLNFARFRSLDLGYEGRVALHALPGAERFYDSRNMMNFGADSDKEDLIYFEYGRLRR
ncbi:MAG: GNAT family N-acetyltransferase [Coleofasciculus sp. A1-SPW-01]|uniref:GNAT family N-acetyltransferase n=1 Tax=Coleofasciculus sp. A1-SPW-01 TaxID=3070819 RepID=UPI0032FD475D